MTNVVRLFACLGVSVSVVLGASDASAQCKGSFPTLSLSAVIGSGGWLSSDGRGAYVDGTQGSTVTVHIAASLSPNWGVHAGKNARFIAFNLNSPVVGDPLAQALGVVPDDHGEVHVLNYLDPVGTDGLRLLHSIQELPDDGVFYTSERTDLFVSINGVRHLLMFGGDTYPINVCNTSLGAVFAAAGTTKLQIARQGDTYILQAPPGSIARLYDYSNRFAPLDKGLYRFSFGVTFSRKAKKGR